MCESVLIIPKTNQNFTLCFVIRCNLLLMNLFCVEFVLSIKIRKNVIAIGVRRLVLYGSVLKRISYTVVCL